MPRYSYCPPEEILALQPGKLIALPPDPLPWSGWDGFYAWMTLESGKPQRVMPDQAVTGREAEKALRAWISERGPRAFYKVRRKQLAFRERAILVFDVREETWRNLPDFVREGLRR